MGRRDLLLLSIFTLVTTFAWVAFDVHHAYVTSTTPQSVEEQLAPINPTFNQELIEKIKRRQQVEPLDQAISIAPSLNPVQRAATPSVATQSGGR